MTKFTPDRRQFLRYGASLAPLGVAAPFALQMAAVGSAAAQTAPGYRAIVCLFMFGGNDGHNTLLATDTDSWNRYFPLRNTGSEPLALMAPGTAPNLSVGRTDPRYFGGVLPINLRVAQPIPPGTNATNRTFAVHPYMTDVQRLFNAGRLAFLANVGTLVGPTTKAQYNAGSVRLPKNLFSHNDQQSTWQSGDIEGARSGYGGLVADLVYSMNGQNTLFTAISAAGQSLFLAGGVTVAYPLSTGATPAQTVGGTKGSNLFGSNIGPAKLSEIIQDTSTGNYFATDHAEIVKRSMRAADVVNAAFALPGPSAVLAVPSYTNPASGGQEANSLANQLRTVARMIASASSLGIQRQVFFVSLGGFDTHNGQNRDHTNLIAKVSHALGYFDNALANINGVDMRANVTTFTASDFSRTFNPNGDGTDHAWGNHHMIMGGAVRGQAIFGQYPTVGANVTGFNNPDLVGNALLPTTSVDQYIGTIGKWFGVSDSNLRSIFPNLGNFSTTDLGFMS